MVMEIRPPEDIERKRDEMVLEMLLEALNVLGGPRKIVEFRNLTWIPSIIKANYALLLSQAGKTHEEIAAELGLTKATVDKMLRADPEDVLRKIRGELAEEKIDDHIAGGLAKLAYKNLVRRRAEREIDSLVPTVESLGVEWAVVVLRRIKGLDFPVDREALQGRLSGLAIYDIPITNILNNLRYPIESPASLLKSIAEYLRSRGLHPSKGK